jgi:hypothetical protein
MKRLALAMCGFTLLFVLFIMGCGTGTNQAIDVRASTKGQEIQNLDEVRKKGIITQKEYEKQKKLILRRK